MKILITGGTGLVGHGIKEISKNYPEYEFIFMSSKDCNLINFEKTLTYFKNVKPEYVIHLAASVGGLFKNMNYKVDMFEKNILLNHNVLKVCHLTNVKKVVSCLSTCIFPDKTTYPINEDMLHNGPPHFSNDAYAYAKRMLEVQSNAYQEQYNKDFICIIPTNIYGPNDNYSLEDGHVIPSLIHRCYLNKQNNENFIVRGTGKPLRQFIYSTDLAYFIMWSLIKYDQKKTLILSVSENDECSIGEVAKIIAKSYNYENKMVFDETFADGQFKKTADNSLLMKLHGDYNFISIKEGIKKSVEWFIKNYENARK
jgi:GDP-L-fucose synthase